MAKKTTKAQRRAAKLNRRSKDYRRQIAAQARKEEQAEKPKKTSTRAKNPTPKKVYKHVSTYTDYDAVSFYRPAYDDVIVSFCLADEKIAAIVSNIPRGMSPHLTAEDIRNTYPDYGPIYSIRLFTGATLEDARKFILKEGRVDFMAGLLEKMKDEGIGHCWIDYHKFIVDSKIRDAA